MPNTKIKTGRGRRKTPPRTKFLGTYVEDDIYSAVVRRAVATRLPVAHLIREALRERFVEKGEKVK